MTRKLLSLLVVAALLLTVTGALNLDATARADGVTIQIVVPDNVQDFPEGITEDNNFIVDYWREQTGYDFDVIVLNSEDATQQLNVMFNSGEINGIVVTRAISNVGKYASEGMLMNLDEYKESSELYKMFAEYSTVGMYDGSQYAFVVPEAILSATYRGQWVVNKGAMADLGYNEVPADFATFEKMMYDAKDAGFVPLAVFGDPSSPGTFSLISGMFGLGGGLYGIDAEGKAYNKFLSDAGKAYLEYVKKLYDDGIIPADFASQTEDGVMEMLLSGKALTMTGAAVWSGPGMMSQAEELGLTLRWADYPTDINGNTSYSSYNGSSVAALAFVISSDCEYVEEALKVIDLMCTPEAIELANYGIEGVHYTKDENGVITPIEGAESIDWAVYFRNVFMPEDWYPVYGVGSNWAEYFYPAERPSVGNPNGDPTVFLPPQTEALQTLSDLNSNIVKPYFTQVIMGEASLDDWDSIVEKWMSNGGEEALQAYTDLYAACGSPEMVYYTYLPAEHPAYTGKYLFDGEAALASQITCD